MAGSAGSLRVALLHHLPSDMQAAPRRCPNQPSLTLMLTDCSMAPGLQGAIYLDSDLEAVRRCYLAHFPLPEDPLVLLKVGAHLLASSEA